MIKFPYHSHRNDQHSGDKAPVTAHMALKTGALNDPSAILPIPVGSHLFFIEDPRRANTIIEVILKKVIYENHVFKGIEAVAMSGNWASTRRLFLTAAWDGEYKSALTKDEHAIQAKLDGKEPTK